MVNSSFFNSSQLAKAKVTIWDGLYFTSTFVPDSIVNNIHHTLSNITLGEKEINNVTVSYIPNLRRNSVGNKFFRRFKSFTLDYLNNNLYLELPKDIQIYDIYKFNFTSKVINEATIENLNEIFELYNSYGFAVLASSPHTIVSKELGSPNTKELNLNDTLIGINSSIYSKKVFNKIKNKSDYKLVLDAKKQEQQLAYIFHRTSEATFHFLKNGRMITINGTRSKFLEHPPVAGYTFQFKNTTVPYYAMHFYTNLKEKKMSVHFLWESFSNKKIELKAIDYNNKEVSLNNTVKKIVLNK